ENLINKNHVVFYSGGLGSYATAVRVIEKHGTDNLYLLFTDTLIEDNDLYRFIIETAGNFFNVESSKIEVLLEKVKKLTNTEVNMGKRKVELEELRILSNKLIPQMIWLSDGIDPWDIFFEQRFLGNSRIAQCSSILKQKM